MANAFVYTANPKKKGGKKKKKSPPRHRSGPKKGQFKKRKKPRKGKTSQARKNPTKRKTSKKKTTARKGSSKKKKGGTTKGRSTTMAGKKKGRKGGKKKPRSRGGYKRNPKGLKGALRLPSRDEVFEGLGAGGAGIATLWGQKFLVKDDTGPIAYGLHWVLGQLVGNVVAGYNQKMGKAIKSGTTAIVGYRIFSDHGPKVRPEGLMGDYVQSDLLGGPKALEIPPEELDAMMGGLGDDLGDYVQSDMLGEDYPAEMLGQDADDDPELVSIGAGGDDDLMSVFSGAF